MKRCTAWGFDHTDFGSATNFKKVLRAAGAKPKPRLDERSLRWNFFVWEGTCVDLMTYYNPLTGDGPYGDLALKEKGFAGYIGISGDSDRVRKVVAAIKTHAVYIKDESPYESAFI